MTKTKQNTIPIFFQQKDVYEDGDTRFLHVAIWMCHTGKNLNGSYFEKSVIEKAIPSLANTPILAFIEENSLGEKDFSDHRVVLEEVNGDLHRKYIGSGIGVIPESNHARFEWRVCDDGIEREYLVVDGLIWQNKWDDAPDIFRRDIVKGQSMELDDQHYAGYYDQDGYFHFTKFQFYGACCLGIDYEPAMVGSTIELRFEKTHIFDDVQKKFQQWKALAVKNHLTAFEDNTRPEETNQEGGNVLAKENPTPIENPVAEPETPVATAQPESPVTEPVTGPVAEPKAEEPAQEIIYTKEQYDALQQEFETYKATYCTPETEVETLRQFQADRLAEDRANAEQEIFTRFTDLEDVPEFKELRDHCADYTLEALEEKCFTIRGKQVPVKFTKKTPERTTLPVTRTQEETDEYAGLFDKYGVKKED